jgi:uroporphyrinogen-III synthase
VFASANAVHAFFDRVKARAVDLSVWRRVATFAVGPRTAQALHQHGVTAAAVPATFTGAALGQMLGARDIRGKRFLLPRGDRGREEIADALTAAGAEVVPVVVYRAAGPDPATASAMRTLLTDPDRKAIYFASPSAVEECARLFSRSELADAMQRCIVVAIGSTTGKAAQRHGIPVHGVAAEATDSGLVGALRACLAAHARQ